MFDKNAPKMLRSLPLYFGYTNNVNKHVVAYVAISFYRDIYALRVFETPSILSPTLSLIVIAIVCYKFSYKNVLESSKLRSKLEALFLPSLFIYRFGYISDR